MMRRVALVWLLACLLAQGLRAQYPLVRPITLRDGQRALQVRHLVQDDMGMLWVGGDRGLFRTDGDRTDAILKQEQGTITALHAQGTDVHAALSNGQIVRCDGAGCDTVYTDSAFTQAPVRSLVVGADGALWIGTYGLGVHIRAAGGTKLLTHAQGLADEHVNAMCRLSDGRIAIATDQGVTIAEPGGQVSRTVSEADGIPDNLVLSLTTDRTGRLWCGSDKGGVFSFDPNDPAATFKQLPYAGVMPPVVHLLHSGDRIWIGTDGQGTLVGDITGAEAFYFAYTVEQGAGTRITSMLLDQDGAAWWADGSATLRRADGHALLTPIHEGVDLRSVTAITAMAGQRIAFAQEGTVFIHATSFNDQQVLQRVALPVDATTQIVALYADGAGDLWAGTFGSGVFRIHADGRFDRFGPANGGFSDNVLAIRAHGDSLWFATLSGVQLVQLRAGVPPIPRTVRIPGSGFTYDVLPLADGTVLVATDGSGVVRLRPGAEPEVLYDPEEKHRTFYSLCVDAQGHAWACGPGTGVLRVGASGLETVLPPDAPTISEVYSIAPYRDGLILLGAEGLLAMDPRKAVITDLTHAYELEGVQAGLNTAALDGSGAVWLATSKGLLRLDAAGRTVLPSIATRILFVSQGAERIAPDGSLELSQAQDHITIRFTGIHFGAPEDVRFAYRLVGADTTVRFTRDRELTFTRLRSGDYRFEVIAFTGSRPAEETWASVEFTVPSPWWRRWWAFAGLLVVIGVIVAVVVRTREARLRLEQRMEEEKVRFQMQVLRSQVNPHFLFNSFNTLIGLIEENPGQAVNYVEHLSDFFREILQVRDKELIPLREELRLVHTYFFLEQRRFGDRISLRVEPEPSSLDLLVPPLTVQLLVENALKHNRTADPDPLVISITSDADSLTVSNPYRPRGTTQRSTGFGIGSIRQRFGALTERSVDIGRVGDAFVARIPLIPNHT